MSIEDDYDIYEDELYDEYIDEDMSLLRQFLEKENIELNETTNIINPNAISKLTTSWTSNKNNLFLEFKANIYYSFVIIRKIMKINNDFMKQYLDCLNKLVHPSLQLFYGLLIEKTNTNNNFTLNPQEPSSQDTQRNNNINLSLLHKNSSYQTNLPSITLSVILEQPKGISLDQLQLLNIKNLSSDEINKTSFVILKKICEALIFIHNSGFPYLCLNSRSVSIDYELISNENTRKRMIVNRNQYLESHLIKLSSIGLYSTYKSSFFSYENFEYSEECFNHPMMLHKLKEGIKEYSQIIDSDYKRYDTWSYLAIVLEILSDVKHVEAINIADFKESVKLYSNEYISSNSSENMFQSKNDEKYFKSIHKDMIDSVKVRLNNTEFIDNLIKLAFEAKDPKEGNLKQLYFKLIDFINTKVFDDKAEIVKDINPYVHFSDYELSKFINLKEANELIAKADELMKELTVVDNKLQEIENIKSKENKRVTTKYSSKGLNKQVIIESILLFHVTSNYNLFITNNICGCLLAQESVFSFTETKYNSLRLLEEYFKTSLINDGTSIYYSSSKRILFISGGKLTYNCVKLKNSTQNFVESTINEPIEEADLNMNSDSDSEGRKNENENLTNSFQNMDNKNLSIQTNQKKGILKKIKIPTNEIQSFRKESRKQISTYNLSLTTNEINKIQEYYTIVDIRKSKTENQNNKINIDQSFNKTMKKNNFTLISIEKSGFISDSYPLLSKNLSCNMENQAEVILKNTHFYGVIQHSLIKRVNHTIYEYGDSIFLIGGEQDKTCEIYDIQSDTFSFFEELNTIHINPVVFMYNKLLYSLNFSLILTFKAKYDLNKKILNKKESYTFIEYIDIHSPDSLSWEKSKVEFGNLMSINSADFTYWKAINLNEGCIIFLFSSGFETGKLYSTKLCICEKEIIFEKPKQINTHQKLYKLLGSLRTKSNVVVENGDFVFFDEIENKILKFNRRELLV